MRAAAFHASRVLELDETTDASPRCPACGSSAPRRSAASIQRDPRIVLLECPTCGGASASRMPTNEALTRFYDAYYSGRDGPRVTLHGVEGWARHIARAAAPAASGASRALLDFGGGDGSLGCAVARRLGPAVRVTLVDHTAPRARDVTWHRDLAEANGPFDVVLASAVLEHIPDLQPVLINLLERVKPGGTFYARTPYVSPFMRFFSMDFGYPGHVHDLGPGFWNRLHERVPGFELVVSRPARVETSFTRNFGRTLAAHVLKAPARVEVAIRGRPRHLAWPFVGGWEVVLRRAATDSAHPRPGGR